MFVQIIATGFALIVFNLGKRQAGDVRYKLMQHSVLLLHNDNLVKMRSMLLYCESSNEAGTTFKKQTE